MCGFVKSSKGMHDRLAMQNFARTFEDVHDRNQTQVQKYI